MKAVVCCNAELKVVDRPEPVPAKGQSVVKVSRCGICGTDLHVRHHCDPFRKLTGRVGYDNFPRSDEALVFGHEFCGEVLDHGRTVRGDAGKTRQSAAPLVARLAAGRENRRGSQAAGGVRMRRSAGRFAKYPGWRPVLHPSGRRRHLHPARHGRTGHGRH
jgi:threonine dehydrogenase-like Zn-dependent dehydrogenase